MAESRRRGQGGPRDADGSLLRAAVLSAVLHSVAILLLLLAPHRLQSAPPTAYTVDIVDPGALGGKLLAGPIGGPPGRQAPPKPAPEPPKAEEAPPEPPEPKEPEVVAKAEPDEPEPERVVDDDTMPIGLARPTPTAQPTRRIQPTARPTPAPARTRAIVAPSASPRRPVSSPRPSAKPESRDDERSIPQTPRVQSTARGAERAQPSPAPDLDSQLAAAIKGVESKVERNDGRDGLTGAAPGGGMGGTESRLDRPPGVGGEGPGGGGTQRSLEYVIYYDQMTTRIKKAWKERVALDERPDLRVTARFGILDSGEIVGIRLVERSGDPSYDAAVERALKRAGPLGPPPVAYRKDFADVTLIFTPDELGGR